MASYTKKIGDKICERIANSSIGLRHICAELKLPYSTVTSWIYNKEHELYDKYAQAKVRQMDYLIEEIINIADDGTNDYMELLLRNGKTKIIHNKEAIARTRIRIQARISIITKLAPFILSRETKKKEVHTVTFIPAPVRPAPAENSLPQTEEPAQSHASPVKEAVQRTKK